MLRISQIFGILLYVLAVALTYLALAPITPESSASSASAMGLWVLFAGFPIFVGAGVLSIPSCLALSSKKLRSAAGFTGWFWKGVWASNCLLSSGFLVAVLYFAYIYWLA